MNNPKRQAKLAEAFRIADTISRLEGYDPDDFEEKQKTRIVRGEISTEEFIQIMHARAQEIVSAEAGVTRPRGNPV